MVRGLCLARMSEEKVKDERLEICKYRGVCGSFRESCTFIVFISVLAHLILAFYDLKKQGTVHCTIALNRDVIYLIGAGGLGHVVFRCWRGKGGPY